MKTRKPQSCRGVAGLISVLVAAVIGVACPLLAAEAADVENPEIVLFTSLDIDRENANTQIRKAGLSGLHSIRRVIKLDEIPLLGTGKTNYRALKEILKNPS